MRNRYKVMISGKVQRSGSFATPMERCYHCNNFDTDKNGARCLARGICSYLDECSNFERTIEDSSE